MRRLLVCLTLLAACATPRADADPFEAARPEHLRTCVERAGVSREALAQCVGALARPCVSEDGGATSSEVLCWSAEAHAWRVLDAQAQTRLQQAQTYRDPARLAAANAAWEAWADAECEYWAWEEGGGSGEQVDRARCHARVSAARAIDLMLATAVP